jgi:hypothetical protein
MGNTTAEYRSAERARGKVCKGSCSISRDCGKSQKRYLSEKEKIYNKFSVRGSANGKEN